MAGRLISPSLCGPTAGESHGPYYPYLGPLPSPMAASKESHPVECELPNDDGRAEGAGWIHGTASEVDLGSERSWVQGVERFMASLGGDSPFCLGLETQLNFGFCSITSWAWSVGHSLGPKA